MAINKKNGTEVAGMQLLLNKMNTTANKVRLGQLLDNQKGSVRAIYDFAVAGGAVSTINLVDENGEDVILPDNAVITNVIVDIITAMTSTGGTGTIALNSEGAGDLLAAVDADTLSGLNAGVPVGTAATSVKLTAERTLTVAIATAAVTAGKFVALVDYTVSV